MEYSGLEGKSAESIRKASERIAKVLEEVDIQRTAAIDDYCVLCHSLNHCTCSFCLCCHTVEVS